MTLGGKSELLKLRRSPVEAGRRAGKSCLISRPMQACYTTTASKQSYQIQGCGSELPLLLVHWRLSTSETAVLSCAFNLSSFTCPSRNQHQTHFCRPHKILIFPSPCICPLLLSEPSFFLEQFTPLLYHILSH